MDAKDKIISIITSKGPVLPKDIAKELNLSLTFAGAYLSELVSLKKILISNSKIGGSPVYYIEAQKIKLGDKLYQYLNEKEKQAYDLIKQNKVLRDNNQAPLIRVALREIKDFAIPLQVNLASGKEVYWKWHLIENSEVEQIIKKSFEESSEIKTKIADKEIKRSSELAEEISPIQKQETVTQKTTLETPVSNDVADELQDKLSNMQIEAKDIMPEKSKTDTSHKVVAPQTHKPDTHAQNYEGHVQNKEKQENFEKKSVSEILLRDDSQKDEFLLKIKEYFGSIGANILNYEIIKKKSEIDLIVSVPSALGRLDYYVKARKKKRCNEGDASAAFVKGQLKKLPVLFLTTGSLTKKAQKLVDEEFKNFIVKQLED